MKKVAFILERDDPRLPIHQNSLDGYNQKKIKTLTTKNFFSKTTTKKSDCKNLNIVAEKDLLNADILCSVNPIEEKLLKKIKKPTKILGIYNPSDIKKIEKLGNKELLEIYSFFSLPRISRAQNMDALSSQANLVGYASVIYAANKYPKVFPMMTTAAGTLPPVVVTVLGVGVAGLQGIATAKRLGAQVWAYDVRAEVEEQVLSLGGKFIKTSFTSHDGVYAKELSNKEEKELQKELLSQLERSDLIFTFAHVPGKKAPILITNKMMKNLKKDCLIIDTSANSGGNCEGTIRNKVVNKNGVLIDGNTKILELVKEDASKLYSENIRHFVELLIEDENDEVIQGSKMYPKNKEGS